MNDLTVSNIERQNVLNNRYALQTIQENLDVDGLRYHDNLLFTTKMVADFYEVDERTIKRYIQEYGDELRAIPSVSQHRNASNGERKSQTTPHSHT